MSPKDVAVVPQGEEEVWVQVLRTLVPRTALSPHLVSLPWPKARNRWSERPVRVCGAGDLWIVKWLLKRS